MLAMSALAKAGAGLVPSSVNRRLITEKERKKKKKKKKKKEEVETKTKNAKRKRETEEEGPSIVLFKTTDARVYDNPAFRHAAAAGRGVFPLFVWSVEQGSWGSIGVGFEWREKRERHRGAEDATLTETLYLFLTRARRCAPPHPTSM